MLLYACLSLTSNLCIFTQFETHPVSHITLAKMSSKSDIRLDGKVALITGAGRGLGAIMAKTFAERGASVVINYAKSGKPAMETVAAIEKMGGKAVAIQGDVSKVADINKLFEQAYDHFGQLDIVVNNAGMEAFAKPEEVTEELWDQVFNINTRAQFFVGQNALKYLSSKLSHKDSNFHLHSFRGRTHHLHVIHRRQHVRCQPRSLRRLEVSQRGSLPLFRR